MISALVYHGRLSAHSWADSVAAAVADRLYPGAGAFQPGGEDRHNGGRRPHIILMLLGMLGDAPRLPRLG